MKTKPKTFHMSSLVASRKVKSSPLSFASSFSHPHIPIPSFNHKDKKKNTCKVHCIFTDDWIHTSKQRYYLLQITNTDTYSLLYQINLMYTYIINSKCKLLAVNTCYQIAIFVNSMLIHIRHINKLFDQFFYVVCSININ